MNLILIEPGELQPGGAARIGGDRARHILTVLKSAPGHELRVGLVNGPVGTATIASITPGSHPFIELRCVLDMPGQPDSIPSVPPVDLLLALPRPKVMRRLWAQLAALGVGRIILTNAERVERDYFDTHILRPETYRPLLIEGLQQARDTRVPEVSIHKRFKVLVEDELDTLCPQRARFVAHPGRKAAPVAIAGERVLLAIGPEGGWNPFELSLLESRGFVPVSLGPRPLRTDTACIAMLALVGAGARG